MSKNLTTSAVIEFDSEVKHAYQQSGKLRECVTTRTNVVGESYKFARMGKGLANQKATQADVTPMDIDHARQTATLANWNAPEYTDIFDAAEVNFDEKQELASSIGQALSRRLDQIIIDTMSGVTYSTTPANIDQGYQIAAGGAQFTVAKVLEASKALTDRGVPEEDRYIAFTAEDRQNFLNETEVGSFDYNSVKALVNGQIDTFLGFKFKTIETRDEGGLPSNKAFAWHKSAVGLAIGIDIKTEINYIAQKTSWLCNGMLKAGAVAREAAGLVEINMA